MTTREQAIEMATDAGALRRNGEYCFTEELLLELIAIATNAALEQATAECEKPNEHGFHRTCCEVLDAIISLKVPE